jgi:AraC-like DNA-binding protein
MKRPSQRSPESLHVHRLTAGTQLVLSDSDTVILVLRGACATRSARQDSKRLEAGTLVLRRAANTQPVDKRIARAIGLLQAEPAKPWTVQQLARAVGLSRAAFARRFSAVTGRAPRQFLNELRLGLAVSLLESTDDSLAEVALHVGYASEFAFSRAFKRKHGLAPGSFRRQQQGAHVNPIRLAA